MMKKSTLLLFWALCCGISAAVAQDLIVRTDSTRIEARVTEVSPETVRYKRFSNPDGDLCPARRRDRLYPLCQRRDGPLPAAGRSGSCSRGCCSRTGHARCSGSCSGCPRCGPDSGIRDFLRPGGTGSAPRAV